MPCSATPASEEVRGPYLSALIRISTPNPFATGRCALSWWLASTAGGLGFGSVLPEELSTQTRAFFTLVFSGFFGCRMSCLPRIFELRRSRLTRGRRRTWRLFLTWVKTVQWQVFHFEPQV